MGFYIRKSISAGPFRFNLSGSGIGMSVGVKGFRVGTGPRGNYVHMGRGGLYYRASLGGTSRSQIQRARPYSVPAAQPTINAESLTPIEVGNVLDMEPSNGSHIVGQINEKLALWRTWPWCLAAGSLLSVSLLNQPDQAALGIAAAIITLIVSITAARWDQTRKAVVIMYDLVDEAAARFKLFTEEFDKVANAARIWNVDTAGRTYDWKRNAGASHLITRKSASLSYRIPSVVKTNVDIPAISGGRQSIYFFPDVVLIVENGRAGALSYAQFRVIWNTSVFIESDGVPSDSEVIGYTWRFVNKNGGPDRRFNNNRQIPRVRYQDMGLQGDGGLQKLLQISKVSDRSGFDTALDGLRSLIKDLQHLALLPPPDGASPTAAPSHEKTGVFDTPSASQNENPATETASTSNTWIWVAIVAFCAFSVVGTFSVNRSSFLSIAPTQIPDAASPPLTHTAEPEVIAPSFDCAKAHSRVLRLVCSTPSLSLADRNLANAYSVALSKAHSKRRLRASEKAWIMRRNNSRADVVNLQRMYQQRMAFLERYNSPIK